MSFCITLTYLEELKFLKWPVCDMLLITELENYTGTRNVSVFNFRIKLELTWFSSEMQQKENIMMHFGSQIFYWDESSICDY